MPRLILASMALAAAVAGYLYWNSDERQIRRLLDRVVEAVSVEEDAGGVAQLAEVAGLASDLAPDVTIELEPPFRALTGSQDVVSTVGRLRAVTAAVGLEIADAEIAVDGATASVRARARLTLRDREGGEEEHVRDVVILLGRRDAGWLITGARIAAGV